jgi:aspartate aminotransferase-like enzyme
VAPELMDFMKERAFHHRSREFQEIYSETRRLLRYLFQSQSEALILASSGTGAMECAARTVLRPGDTAIVLNGGKFGARWLELCSICGAKPVNVAYEWGDTADPMLLEDALRRHPQARAVFATHCETSTGVLNDVRTLAETMAGGGALFVVDAISSLATAPFKLDDWGIDVAVGASHKGLGLPPGLSFVCMSESARRLTSDGGAASLYFDFHRARQSQSRNESLFTAPTYLVAGLYRSLKTIEERGLEQTWQGYEHLARCMREAVQALGLELLPRSGPSPSLTAVKAPENVDVKALVATMASKFRIQLAGGQGKLQGKIFRIGHMGDVSTSDLLQALSALELALLEHGYRGFDLGSSLRAFQSLQSTQERTQVQ